MTLFIDHYHLIRENIMKHTTLAATLIAAGILLTTGSANAALVSVLGGQAINDTDRNIVWAADANLAATNTFGVSGINSNGSMTWDTATSWIAAMNAANYLGYNDWRLPTTTPVAGDSNFNYNFSYDGTTDGGYNNTASEMGHLFYSELGNKGLYDTAGNPQAYYGLTNTGPFTHFQSNGYWSGTEYAPYPGLAWVFSTGHGLQGDTIKNVDLFALAVRPGQIAAVPEPETFAMLMAGLGLMGFVARRKQA